MDALSVILIAPPGFWRKSLQVLLHAAPAVGNIYLCDDTTLALCYGEDVAPSLIIADADHGIQADDVTALRQRWPATCLLVLVDQEQEIEAALGIGFHKAFTKGVLATRLSAAIDALLQEACSS